MLSRGVLGWWWGSSRALTFEHASRYPKVAVSECGMPGSPLYPEGLNSIASSSSLSFVPNNLETEPPLRCLALLLLILFFLLSKPESEISLRNFKS